MKTGFRLPAAGFARGPFSPQRPQSTRRPVVFCTATALGAALVLAACANDRSVRADPAAAATLDAQAPDAAPAPAPAPPPENAVVPKGCDINLGGRYKLSKKPFWTYQLEDDGVHLIARRADLPDAGAPADGPADAGTGQAKEPGAPALVLDRTARGFVGNELGYARSPSGKSCPVAFRAEVVACDAQGVTLRSEDAVALDDECRIQRKSPGSTTEKVLVRQ